MSKENKSDTLLSDIGFKTITTSDIKSIISQMTLEEKTELCSGLGFWYTKPLERLGIPSLHLTDGPHGVRKATFNGVDLYGRAYPSTCFPTSCALAATWDVDLIEEVGKKIGIEAANLDVDILLGPGVNIKRSPLCGRNFEYYSEDPCLSGEIGAAFVNGIQKSGPGACVKHYACNNQEFRRTTVSSEVDERTLREIYLEPFERVIKKSNPLSIMTAYNKVNGTYSSHSKKLLIDILRSEWEYKGLALSDWGAVKDVVEATTGGLGLEMPENKTGSTTLVEAVTSGALDEKLLDMRVEQILNVVLLSQETKKKNQKISYDIDAHHLFATKVAAEAMVLLKNENNLLPLDSKSITSVAVIGQRSVKPRIQGGGSSGVTPYKTKSPLDAIKETVGNSMEVFYADGYDVSDESILHSDLIDEAIQIASKAEVCIVFLSDEAVSEGYDRKLLDISPAQWKVVEEVSNANPNTIVIMNSGSAVTMPWIGNVRSVLQSWLSGQAHGEAICQILFGETNPCGKLPESFPVLLEDTPSYLNFPGELDSVRYGEGIFVGYRYYEKKKIPTLFPFGHGLSYTQFEYSHLETVMLEDGDKIARVRFTVKNSGNRKGKEIVQLYIRDCESSFLRPEKELKYFCKIELNTLESKQIEFTLNKRDISFYHSEKKDWVYEKGTFEVLIGASSSDIRLRSSFYLNEGTLKPKGLDLSCSMKDWTDNKEAVKLLREIIPDFMNDPVIEIAAGGCVKDIIDLLPEDQQGEIRVAFEKVVGLLD